VVPAALCVDRHGAPVSNSVTLGLI
jgi:hypothetical protein